MTAFERAWDLLKQDTRQSTLGEYHPDFPSPYGDVKYYHGTTVEPASRINFEGLKPSTPYEGPQYGPDIKQMFPKGVYATNEKDVGFNYADSRGKSKNQQGRVFGIREGAPQQANPKTPLMPNMEHNVFRFDEKIPRQYLTPVSKMHFTEYQKCPACGSVSMYGKYPPRCISCGYTATE